MTPPALLNTRILCRPESALSVRAPDSECIIGKSRLCQMTARPEYAHIDTTETITLALCPHPRSPCVTFYLNGTRVHSIHTCAVSNTQSVKRRRPKNYGLPNQVQVPNIPAQQRGIAA